MTEDGLPAKSGRGVGGLASLLVVGLLPVLTTRWWWAWLVPHLNVLSLLVVLLGWIVAVSALAGVGSEAWRGWRWPGLGVVAVVAVLALGGAVLITPWNDLGQRAFHALMCGPQGCAGPSAPNPSATSSGPASSGAVSTRPSPSR